MDAISKCLLLYRTRGTFAISEKPWEGGASQLYWEQNMTGLRLAQLCDETSPSPPTRFIRGEIDAAGGKG